MVAGSARDLEVTEVKKRRPFRGRRFFVFSAQAPKARFLPGPVASVAAAAALPDSA